MTLNVHGQVKYQPFIDHETGQTYGSFLLLKVDGDHPFMKRGWYWQAEFEGYLPDGDLQGPFDTEREAYADATGE